MMRQQKVNRSMIPAEYLPLCKDCPAFQRFQMSLFCVAESLAGRPCVINTTFSEKIYSRWCCIDRLSWQRLSGVGQRIEADRMSREVSANYLSIRRLVVWRP